MHGFVERRADLAPVGIGWDILEQCAHILGLLFVGAAAALGAHCFRRGKMRARIKPSAQNRSARKRCRFAGQIREHALVDVLRQVCIAIDPPQRCRIHQVQMPPHQFAKRLFRTRIRIRSQ